jgi:hypothetical protein
MDPQALGFSPNRSRVTWAAPAVKRNFEPEMLDLDAFTHAVQSILADHCFLQTPERPMSTMGLPQ